MTDNMTANNTIDPCQLVAGQLLAQQREKLGLTVEECANTLKLSVTKIKALESGDSQPFYLRLLFVVISKATLNYLIYLKKR